MNSFVHQGLNVEIEAPYEVEAGGGVLKGVLFGIARSWAAAGDAVKINTSGVFDLERCGNEDWQVGDRIYWNDDTKCFTVRPEKSVLVGFAVANSGGADRPFGRVKLIGYAT